MNNSNGSKKHVEHGSLFKLPFNIEDVDSMPMAF